MNIDFKSLSVKNDLNPDIWNSDKTLKPEVREKLMKIAKDFFQDLEIPWAQLEDVIFTGSLANYNWSKFSDIDLHLVINFDLVDEKTDFVEEYFSARKNLWNDMHDIKIHDFDVEVYVQNEKEPHYSSGVFSVLNDKWIVEPKKEKPLIQKEAVGRKIKVVMRLIDDVIKVSRDEDHQKTIDRAEQLTDKIKKMRTCGLEKGGEFSVENLVFKILRRNGYLDKLWDAKIEAYDKMMSIE